MAGKDDDTEHLPYATEEHAVLVTRDRPFAGRTQKRTDHAGLICWTGQDNDIGGMCAFSINSSRTTQLNWSQERSSGFPD
jgi:hypothetical protein